MAFDEEDRETRPPPEERGEPHAYGESDSYHHTRKKRRPPSATRGRIITAVVLVALAGGLYWLSQNIAGVTRPDQIQPTVNLLPPPPPAPPPPPPPPPPPEQKPLEPPKPTEQPKSADQPRQLTINGPAQAGGDAFGIKAGSGGGSTLVGGPTQGGPAGAGGGGFAEASYGRYLSGEIQRAVQSDDRVSRQVFQAEVAVWIDGAGRLTRARILKGSGDSRLDQQLIATLEGMRSVGEPPPAAFRFPQRVSIRGRRA